MVAWEQWVAKEHAMRENNSIEDPAIDYNAGAAAMMQIVVNELVPLVKEEIQHLLNKSRQLAADEKKALLSWENTLERLKASEEMRERQASTIRSYQAQIESYAQSKTKSLPDVKSAYTRFPGLNG